MTGIVKHLFVLLSFLPSLCFGQVDYGYSNSFSLFHNSVDKLRELKVSEMWIKGDKSVNFLKHSEQLTSIYYESGYYHYTYDTIDYEPIDSVFVRTRSVEDHYFNGNTLLDSSYFYSIMMDSNRVDTFKVRRLVYRPDHSPKTRTTVVFQIWQKNDHRTEEHFFGSKNRIDSVKEYSNAQQGTFGTTYLDSLFSYGKYRYIYDENGRKTRKERFFRNTAKTLESYVYPAPNALKIDKAPYHPRSGCLVDGSISHARQKIISFHPNGLVSTVEDHFLTKKENEDWTDAEPFRYEVEYKMEK